MVHEVSRDIALAPKGSVFLAGHLWVAFARLVQDRVQRTRVAHHGQPFLPDSAMAAMGKSGPLPLSSIEGLRLGQVAEKGVVGVLKGSEAPSLARFEEASDRPFCYRVCLLRSEKRHAAEQRGDRGREVGLRVREERCQAPWSSCRTEYRGSPKRSCKGCFAGQLLWVAVCPKKVPRADFSLFRASKKTFAAT